MSPVLSSGSSFPKFPALDPRAIKAVRNSLPGKLLGRTSAILAAAVLVLGFAVLAKDRMEHLGVFLSPHWLNSAVLVGLPSFVIAVQLLNEWQARHNRRRAAELAIKPAQVSEDYFRVGPYLETEGSRIIFERADQAQHKVLEWLHQSNSMPLYLTGDSGSGKTSLLNAFVIPAFRNDDWVVTIVRPGRDAEVALGDALKVPQDRGFATMRALIDAAKHRAHNRLLIVLDQFEEFLILGTPDRQNSFARMLADLNRQPPEGLKILLVVRSDYQTALEEVGLPRLLQGENFFQVGRFREEAARMFFRKSKLGLKDEALDRLLRSAAELDDTPGMIRPITLNVLGHVLRQRGGSAAASLDAGTLVRGYIAEAVENPVIRVWAPPVLEGLLTEQGTKRARREEELASDAKLRTAEVRAVLHALAGAALARPLEATQGVWEFSHDFVARAMSRYLGRRRSAVLRRARAYAAPTLLTLGFLAALGAFIWNSLAPGQIRAELADRGILVESSADGLKANSTSSFKPDQLATIAPLLRTLSVVNLDLSRTQVTNLEPLQGLTTLQQLNLSGTPVANLEPLKGLTMLHRLDLTRTLVTTLEPLQGLTALERLDLTRTPISNLEPLKGLNALQQLDLYGTPVANLEPLKELTTLEQLDLYGTPVTNLEPLKALTKIEQLNLDGTMVTNLEPLRGLTALHLLNLSGTPVANLAPLEGMTVLERLNLDGTMVNNLEPLKGVKALQQLNLSGTPVGNLEPLQELNGIEQLNLSNTQVVNLGPLQGLSALQQLELTGTQVANLEPLQGLNKLQRLELTRTQVANLEPLAGLTALQQLFLYDTPVVNLGPLQRLTTLQYLYLTGTLVANLQPLQGLNALQRLDLARTPVINLESLEGLTALEQLDLYDTQISNLQPLHGLNALQRLDLTHTRVVNLEPLQKLAALQLLNLTGTRVREIQVRLFKHYRELNGLPAITMQWP
jgi:hypothetical protein